MISTKTLTLDFLPRETFRAAERPGRERAICSCHSLYSVPHPLATEKLVYSEAPVEPVRLVIVSD